MKEMLLLQGDRSTNTKNAKASIASRKCRALKVKTESFKLWTTESSWYTLQKHQKALNKGKSKSRKIAQILQAQTHLGPSQSICLKIVDDFKQLTILMLKIFDIILIIPFSLYTSLLGFSVGIYLFRVKNRNTKTRCDIWSKLTTKTPERQSSVSIINFQQVNADWDKSIQICSING